MIPRYTRPEMAQIWSDESKFQIWFEIEAHACDAQAELGVIPENAAKEVWDKGAFEVDRIKTIESEIHHDVLAFLTNLAEHVGSSSRFVHQGMTSSDILDWTRPNKTRMLLASGSTTRRARTSTTSPATPSLRSRSDG